MNNMTQQIKEWEGTFGKEYTDRNALAIEEMESLYRANYGLSRTDLNEIFLDGVDRSIRVLEVGSNVGNQLLCLQKMGYKSLYGIELQSYAVELAKQRTNNINIIQGSAFDIPFKDCYFDLVYTSGVLIHLHPSHIADAMKEIYRCTSKYIWGFEYFSENYTEVVYRGNTDMLWKANFARIYMEKFDDLEMIKEEKIKYLNSENIDSMFILKKKR